jgi:hypothetical protein
MGDTWPRNAQENQRLVTSSPTKRGPRHPHSVAHFKSHPTLRRARTPCKFIGFMHAPIMFPQFVVLLAIGSLFAACDRGAAENDVAERKPADLTPPAPGQDLGPVFLS